MEWPSQNVPQGGFLHPRKVDFSPDTAKFLKELIQESKLSIRQKSKFENMLRNDQVRFYKSPKPTRRTPEITIRPGSPRKRSMQTILQSGAYEREKFVPLHPRIDREKEKEKLQHIMAYNQEVAPKQEWPLDRKLKRESPPAPQVNRYDLLEQEILERQEWLEKMEALGMGDKFRPIIHQQIQAKLREMNRLQPASSR
ncbi:UPF0193 protein EVG1 [Aethina tumida]|uniref:UPF0193 protein EVG1 n=1 Tax=Aethina tumida TaxID=116153 RepID=UPI0021476514|nr:UPF0193 protein EVG1 [Aethina tumida]